MRKQGFDISQYQGVIDWATVAGASLDFVFVRAQVGMTADTLLQSHLSGALDIGLETSIYHVVHENISGETQAGALLEVLAAMQKPRLPIVLDIERPPHAGNSLAHRRTLEHACVMVDMLNMAHYRSMIYTGAWWWNPATVDVDVEWAMALDLWVATYGTQAPILPRGWGDWRLWQYTSSGQIAGIQGGVDLDVFQGDWDAYLEMGQDDVPTFEVNCAPFEIVQGGAIIARFIPVALPVIDDPPESALNWVLPVGTIQYPSQSWGVRGFTHDLRTTEENPNRLNGKPHPHTGYDINLDIPPYGDVERGLPVYAVAAGIVHYVTENWSGVGMCVVMHVHEDAPVWFRYAHINVVVEVGDSIEAGQTLGYIADWPNEGDHLHLDAANDPFKREWIASDIEWVDPAEILKAHIAPELVEAMLRVGD